MFLVSYTVCVALCFVSGQDFDCVLQHKPPVYKATILKVRRNTGGSRGLMFLVDVNFVIVILDSIYSLCSECTSIIIIIIIVNVTLPE